MQCYDKMTGIFIGTRKCRCMHVQGGINALTVQIKATAFGHAHHNLMSAAPICCAPLVKKSSQGDTQMPFSK